MADKITFKDRLTGETLYPVTTMDCILDWDLDTEDINNELEQIKDAQAQDLAKITELQGKLNGITNVKQELDKKADKDELDTLEFTVETLNQGLGYANQDLADLGEKVNDLDSELEKVVLHEEVVDEDTFPEIETLTREDLSKDLFIKLWKFRGYVNATYYAGYDEETGYFTLNGINDIPFEEAIKIYILSLDKRHVYRLPHTLDRVYETNWGGILWYHKVRTLMPVGYVERVSSQSTFQGGVNLEVIQLIPYDSPCLHNLTSTFYNCPRLREIKGDIWVEPYYYHTQQTISTQCFFNCTALESIRIRRLCKSIDFQWSPLLNLESLKYMIEYAEFKEGVNPVITITVHPDVYAKITDSSNTEWYELNNLALTKQITFATV